jgi:predicted Fe-Mo cluster-binding NifX family protein
MKKIAIPVANNALSEYFGNCQHYEVFEIIDGHIVNKTTEIPPNKNIEMLPEWIASKEITDVVTYKVDKRIISLFAQKKINLFVGIKLNSPLKIIDNYLNGTLKSDNNIIKEITEK